MQKKEHICEVDLTFIRKKTKDSERVGFVPVDPIYSTFAQICYSLIFIFTNKVKATR